VLVQVKRVFYDVSMRYVCAFICAVHGNKKRRNDHFPTLFIYFFLSRKIKKIQTKKIIKKNIRKKRAVRVEERKRITTSVDTETTTNEKKKI
jgi:hypothetical protein